MSSDVATNDRPYATPEAPQFTVTPSKCGRVWTARLEHGNRAVSERVPWHVIKRLQQPGHDEAFRCFAAHVAVRLHKRLRSLVDGRTNA